MKFLWFGRKKKPPVVVGSNESDLELQEIYSLVGYVCDLNPAATTKNTELSAQAICSMALSVLAEATSPADLAAQEFFQVQGANRLPVTDYGFSVERGFSARVQDGERSRTVLIGTPAVIAKVCAPFSPAIAQAAIDNADGFMVAIDGIAYASFAIAKELRSE